MNLYSRLRNNVLISGLNPLHVIDIYQVNIKHITYKFHIEGRSVSDSH